MAAPDPYRAYRQARAANLANPVFRSEQEAKCSGHIWKRFELDSLLYRECIFCEAVTDLRRSEVTPKQWENVVRLAPVRRLKNKVCSVAGCTETKGVQMHHTAFVEIFGQEIADMFPKEPLCEYHHLDVLHAGFSAWAAQPSGQMLLPLNMNRRLASG
jgi:hypothetical protein